MNLPYKNDFHLRCSLNTRNILPIAIEIFLQSLYPLEKTPVNVSRGISDKKLGYGQEAQTHSRPDSPSAFL
jgi:hypothetical protein